MTHILIVAGMMIAAFLWGGIPTGYIVVKRLKGIDVRTQGSGNIGATNVRRILGTRWFFGVLFLDAFKGALPVLTALALPGFSGPERVIAAACTIAGNLFSPWLGFKGGKGIGTGLGVLLVLAPFPMLLSLVVFAVFLFALNYISLASLMAAIALPAAIFFVDRVRGIGHDRYLLAFSVLVALALIVMHRSNISRLVNGTEHKFFTVRK
jgi:glycerol-3-phosphate acyltransferase PlsY